MLEVSFHHGRLVPTPLNEGNLPLLELDMSALTALKFAEVTALQKGTPPGSFKFPEQAIRVSGTALEMSSLTGDFALEFNGAVTPLLPYNVSAATLTAALMALDTVGEVEVFGTNTVTSREWKVRFYATGDPAHTGPQPALNVNASTLTSSNRRRLSGLSLSSSIVSDGSTPYSVGNLTAEEDDTGNLTATESVTVTPIVHVCGNGFRSSAEACDDNNTVGGDGCDALCQLELGFACSSSTQLDGGSGVGGLDTCAPLCGDGISLAVRGLEGCDDNNTAAGDGCSSTCGVELGYVCGGGGLGGKDTCASVCGDGRHVGPEACDDGNEVAGDGCDANCAIEPGATCSGGTSSAADTCVACHASCDLCTGLSHADCTSCATAHPFANSLEGCVADAEGVMPLQPCQRCLADCTPVGKYANGSSDCAPCDASCGTCSGPAAHECLSCRSTGGLGFLANSSCVAECSASGTFAQLIGEHVTCQDCHPSCESCSGAGSAACLACPSSGTPFHDVGAFDVGQCLAECPAGKYASGGVCLGCDSSCATCSAAGGGGCTSCPYSAVFSQGQGTCTAACSSGQYDNGGACAPCSASCASCYGAASNCTSCPTSVASYRYKHGATCGAACPTEHYADSSATCQPCDGTCAECSGAGAADCLSCPASGTAHKSGTTCLATCAAGLYSNGDNECQACHSSCATCDGGTAENCTSCWAPQPYLISDASTCVATCPTATYAAAGACTACDVTCAECSGGGPTACTACVSASEHPHLAGGACECSSGYAATGDACSEVDECSTNTDNCHAQATCTNLAGTFSCTCADGYAGDGVTCTDIDECALGAHWCDALASCSNTAGGYTCACTTTGYAGDGFYCADVNECTLGTHDCHADGTCSNLYGTWSCACDSGYAGNGVACVREPCLIHNHRSRDQTREPEP